MIKFRLGRTEAEAPIALKAHREGVVFILDESAFDEHQVAVLNRAAERWVTAVDVWQLWNGEIVDLSEIGPEPDLQIRELAS